MNTVLNELRVHIIFKHAEDTFKWPYAKPWKIISFTIKISDNNVRIQ